MVVGGFTKFFCTLRGKIERWSVDWLVVVDNQGGGFVER